MASKLENFAGTPVYYEMFIIVYSKSSHLFLSYINKGLLQDVWC